MLIFETDFDIAPLMGPPKNKKKIISDKTCGILVEEIARSTSSWVSDPEDQWAWLYKVMDEARRKKQNVSQTFTFFALRQYVKGIIRSRICGSQA